MTGSSRLHRKSVPTCHVNSILPNMAKDFETFDFESVIVVHVTCLLHLSCNIKMYFRQVPGFNIDNGLHIMEYNF